jgi:hypothetical protein
LNKNSPVRFQAMGSVEKLHLTTSGVVKKNDAAINEPMADKTGIAERRQAVPKFLRNGIGGDATLSSR